MDEKLTRWRLILGEGSEAMGELSGHAAERADALGFLYDREGEGRGAGTPRGGGRGGGGGSSRLTVPGWMGRIRRLFPRRTVEILETDALERYGMVEMVTNKEALERVEPSPALLRAILTTKHLMDQEVLAAARDIVRRVVKDLTEKLRPEIRLAVVGKRDPHRRSRIPIAANFDPKATIRANLKNYDPEHGLVISEPLFISRTRRHNQRWQVLIAVDQSGSMTDSVIHSAVTASIFHSIAALRTHLIAFDTQVVDLSSESIDPVETLMRVQLGGGTDIAQAMEYVESLVDVPRRAMVVLITDLYEGGSPTRLASCVQRLCQQGTRVLVLGALDDTGGASFDQEFGAQLARLGAHVGAMTPYDLAEWVGRMIS